MAAPINLMEWFVGIASSAPYVLVLLIGFIWSFVAMGRWPKPALLAAMGTGLLLFNAVVMTMVQMSGAQLLGQNRGSADELRWFFFVLSGVRSMISATGIGLLLIACFSDRLKHGDHRHPAR